MDFGNGGIVGNGGMVGMVIWIVYCKGGMVGMVIWIVCVDWRQSIGL